ncbi:MAG: MEDS domain-containing protein [Halanaerobium sp.]
MENSPAKIIDLEKINLGDHAVLFYKEETIMLNTAAVFIKNSLKNNERCLYIDPQGYKEDKVEEYEIKSWLKNIDKYQKKEKIMKKL